MRIKSSTIIDHRMSRLYKNQCDQDKKIPFSVLTVAYTHTDFILDYDEQPRQYVSLLKDKRLIPIFFIYKKYEMNTITQKKMIGELLSQNSNRERKKLNQQKYLI